jgi:hypothetical protein
MKSSFLLNGSPYRLSFHQLYGTPWSSNDGHFPMQLYYSLFTGNSGYFRKWVSKDGTFKLAEQIYNENALPQPLTFDGNSPIDKDLFPGKLETVSKQLNKIYLVLEDFAPGSIYTTPLTNVMIVPDGADAAKSLGPPDDEENTGIGIPIPGLSDYLLLREQQSVARTGKRRADGSPPGENRPEKRSRAKLLRAALKLLKINNNDQVKASAALKLWMVKKGYRMENGKLVY